MDRLDGPSTPPLRERSWPASLTEVPYWVFQDEEIFRAEHGRLFHGPYWSYLCLETELAEPGDFCATFIGKQPVLVTRDVDGEVYAFENRCAHRGALIAMEDHGHAMDFTCVYHAWTYNLQGDLTAVAFEQGIGGNGGMPPEFCLAHPAAGPVLRCCVPSSEVVGYEAYRDSYSSPFRSSLCL